MPSKTQNFTSGKAQEYLALIADLAADGARFTRLDAMIATGLRESAARGYIARLVATQAIHLAQAALWIQSSRTFGEYAAGPSPDIAPDDASGNDDFPRRVVVRTSWTPNHARMPMECLLFGAPPAPLLAAA